ncbi:MAG: alpha/beta fold hydrolase [Rhodococcus sp. (in: high G+C Gram-positive bacteria)]|uniref:alpha/beta fold hydrolase n=1 Tax=Rhodococcus sp. TaxID=1831 RepID=UPI003BB1AD42
MRLLRSGATGIVVSGLVLFASSPVAVAQEPPAGTDRSLEWRPCPELSLVEVGECAEIAVPLDYATAEGTKIMLTVSRIPAQNPQDRRGVLFGNPGGPGGSALSMFQDTPAQVWPDEFRQEWDLIGVQPRGLLYATPVQCGEPDLADVVTAVTNAGGDLRARCEAGTPGYTRHLTTENTARDFDEVRKALGEEQISIYGISYGTFLGSTYATLFPQQTDRLVLDSGVNPEWLWTQVPISQSEGYKRRARDLFPWIAANDATYGLGDTPLKVYQRWSDRVVAEAGAVPTLSPPPAQIGDVPPGLQAIAQQYRDGVNMTADARTRFEAFMAKIADPGATQAASTTYGMLYQVAPNRDAWPDMALTIRDGPPPGAGDIPEELKPLVASGMNLQALMLCNENQAAVEPQLYPAFLYEALWNMDVFDLMGYQYGSGAGCAGAPPVTRPVTLTGRSLATAPLQLQSRGDPQTPYDGGLVLADQMRSRLVTVGGGDHGVSGKNNPPLNAAIVEYLRTGRTSVTEVPEANIRIR